jgi:hypothetical protein
VRLTARRRPNGDDPRRPREAGGVA